KGSPIMPNALQAPRTEQRREPRYALPARTWCRLRRAIGNLTWQATVRNLSTEGIGLILNRPVKAGMLLTVELPGHDQEPRMVKMMRVPHAAPQPGGCWWVAGGRFASQLSDAELQRLRSRQA